MKIKKEKDYQEKLERKIEKSYKKAMRTRDKRDIKNFEKIANKVLKNI